MAEAAVGVYNKIYEGHGVYLLLGLITERKMLGLKTKIGTSVSEVDEVMHQVESMSLQVQ